MEGEESCGSTSQEELHLRLARRENLFAREVLSSIVAE